MIVANNMPQYDLITELIEEAKAHQSLPRRKANTVTVTIGSLLTGLAASGTYALESQLDLPPWIPLAVMVVGLLGTILGTSQTTNGITDSVAVKLRDELAKRIDDSHYHGDDVPTVTGDEAADDVNVDVLRGWAEQMTNPDDPRHGQG